jgi:hypothetical protein
MEKTVKVTKREYFEAIKTFIGGADNVGGVDGASVVEFIDAQIAQLDARAEKAKAKAAEKRENGDAFREAVYNVITDEFQTVNDIVAQLDYEDVTNAKVVPRLTALVNAGKVVKETVKTEDGKKKAAYKRA